MVIRLVLLLPTLTLLAVSSGAQRRKTALPSSVLPDGLGVNIHFTDPQPGEMKMLAAGGFTWVRMDFAWGGIEREKGQYDFSAYDRLMAALKPYKIHALFILDYSNRFYDNDESPRSEEAQEAFAKWAAASAKHFAGQGILWEMYNEPNIGFWRPRPNVDDYVRLALAVGRAIHQSAPGETYVGPATSGMDFKFLEACFKAGLLEYWDAVSVHPYRQSDPETVIPDYRRLRLLIAKYAPKGKKIPILSGEWGYSVGWGGMNEEKQGRRLARQWLTNVSNDVPLSIWYDWHDDGPDPKEPEHHFGTVLNPYYKDRDPVYDPKPSYLAAKTLTGFIRGYRFNKRLAVGGENNFILLFSKGRDVRLAVWTAAKEPQKVVIPASPGAFHAVGHTGESLPPLTADKNGLAVALTDAPQYLAPEKPNDLLQVAAAWERAPLEIKTPAEERFEVYLVLKNPLSRPVQVQTGPSPMMQGAYMQPGMQVKLPTRFALSRSADPVHAQFVLDVADMGRITQEMQIIVTNPLRVTILPPAGGTLPVRVENPSGEPFAGTLHLYADELKCARPDVPLRFALGKTETTVRFAVSGTGAPSYGAGVSVRKPDGNTILTIPLGYFQKVDDFARFPSGESPSDYAIYPDGDMKVASEQTLTSAAPPDGPPQGGAGALKIAYRFDPGWKFLRVAPLTDALRKIEGKPKALGMWVYGDGQGNIARLRFVDAAGQTFQPGGEAIAWKGWRYIVSPLDASQAGHWGGPDDGVIHYPIRWDTLFLLDSADRQKSEGAVYISSPTLIL
jgi:hypothetical protein